MLIFDVKSQDNALIVDFIPPTGTYERGSILQTTVTIKNISGYVYLSKGGIRTYDFLIPSPKRSWYGFE